MAVRDRVRILQARRTPAIGWRIGWALPLVFMTGLLAVTLAYLVRPPVVLDVGGRQDSIFLSLADKSFHAREFGAGDPTATFEWPAGSDRLEVSEGLNPAFRMVEITLDPWEPNAQHGRRLVAVYANEQRIDTLDDRGGGRAHPILLPPRVDTGRPLLFRVEAIPDRDSLDVPPVQATSLTLSVATTYRWTSGRGVITFPALGRGAWHLSLRTILSHPDGRPVNARVFANGVLLGELPDRGEARKVAVLIPEAVTGNGDLTLEILANTFEDPRPLGALLDSVTLTPARSSWGSLALPPFSLLLPALAALVSVYGTLRWLRLRTALALAAALALALAGAWALVAYRYPMGFFVQPLALLLVATALLTPALDRGTAWVFGRAGVPLDDRLRRALVLIVVASLWIKGGAMVFPYFRAIDIGWHMEWARRLLSGETTLAQLYGTNSPLNENTMPVTEWGANRPVIPYSPFFHLFAVGFAIFPWPLEMSANLMSAFLDASRVLLIALLARSAGLSNRVTLLAGLLFAVTPATFLLHAWGNVPTTFGMWLTLVATVIIVVAYRRLNRRGPFLLLTAVTLACLLFYTVMAAFHAAFVIIFLAIGLIWYRGDRAERRALALASGLALLLSLVIYYGQYILPIFQQTVPYLLQIFSRGPESVGVERPAFSEYLGNYIPHLGYGLRPGVFVYYGLMVPVLLALPGYFALRRLHPLWMALSAWFTVGVLFLLVGYRISMVDKQLFYIMPALAICAAVYLDKIWRSGLAGRLAVVTIYALTLFSAINLWLLRIANSPIG